MSVTVLLGLLAVVDLASKSLDEDSSPCQRTIAKLVFRAFLRLDFLDGSAERG